MILLWEKQTECESAEFLFCSAVIILFLRLKFAFNRENESIKCHLIKRNK